MTAPVHPPKRSQDRLSYTTQRGATLMAAAAALITLEPPAVDKPMFMDIAAGTAEPIRPTSLLQGSLTLLLSAVEPLELRQ